MGLQGIKWQLCFSNSSHNSSTGEPGFGEVIRPAARARAEVAQLHVPVGGTAVCVSGSNTCRPCSITPIWDAREPVAPASHLTTSSCFLCCLQAGRKGLPDTTQVKPGAHWADILLTRATTDWLLALMPAIQGPAASQLAAAARQLVVAFCCLAGDVFPKSNISSAAGAAGGAAAVASAAPVAVAHVAQMLRLVLPWCMPAQQLLQQALAGDEGQLVDACRALAALCAGHKVGVLEAASAALGGQQHGSIFIALEELTRSFLLAGGVSAASSPEPWLPDCTEMLLECWSGLLAPQCGYAMTAVPPPAQAVECATRTAAAVVEAALADAAAGAHEVRDLQAAHAR